ncbi:MAG: glycosyltransferase family 2 protein, partial [bacterium]
MDWFFGVIFWLSIFLIIYVYAGFPLLVVLFARLRKYEVRKEAIEPKVSLVIAAWNEERSIAKKLDNALTLDYPKEKLEIIVASDGSDDNTANIVERYRAEGVVLLDLTRRGKIFALNDAVANATGEVIVFSDANSMYAPEAISMLVRNFADESIGGVCGNQVYLKKQKGFDSTSQGESLYWNFDKWVKQKESESGSIVSADGAIYAIRRSLYLPPASAAVTDDFAISTGVVEQGYRLVFESEAIAFEEPMAAATKEFSRKVRIMNRGLRGVILRKRLLNPFQYGFYSVELFSHKVLRRLVPFFLLTAFISNILLSSLATPFLIS